jgi:ABC-type cobalamin/Fe3+-siderophores transport system ATPase subunit
MKNIDVKVKGNIATITIDLSQNLGPSASGKTTLVASTAGNAPIPGTDVVLGLNAYRKVQRVGA